MSELSPYPAIPAPQPSGIGGWLLFPAISLFIGLPLLVYTFVDTFLPFADLEVWSALLNKQSPYYNRTFAAIVAWEIVANLFLLFLLLWLTALFFRKQSRAPDIYIFFMACNFIIHLLDLIVTTVLIDNPDRDYLLEVLELIRLACVCAIWIPYFRTSVRVKNTFTRT
jgi:hypothetical protein